jgi:hypothetical protein
MSRIYSRLVEIAAGVLEPGERETVLGDFAECGDTGAQALRGLFGLIARRQAALWMDWRPWLVLVSLVVPLRLAPFSCG